MTYVILLIVAFVIFFVFIRGRAGMVIAADKILREKSEQLSIMTGIEANQIYNEMVKGQLTPAEWAEQHGLNPADYEPE